MRIAAGEAGGLQSHAIEQAAGAPHRIRVNALSPGVILTPFHERYSTPQMLESFKGSIPMGRLGTPEECAGAFVYLASDALSGYVTGQILEINGGQYMP